MNLRSLVVSEAGSIRAPWRIVIFCLVSIASIALCALAIGPIVAGLYTRMGSTGPGAELWVEVIGLLVGTAICLRVIDKRPWSEVWLDRGAARPSALLLGFLLGAACIGLPVLALIGGGWLDRAAGSPGSWWVATAHVTLLLLPAALLEELLTRGYLLSVLQQWWGWGWSVAATSVAFGLLHIWNTGVTAGSIGLVTLAGFFLAAVLYATRSLYAAWMAHFAWNWTMAAVFHASVSGFPFEAPAYRYVDAGPDWATGGVWGPEGGLPAAIGMIAGMALLYFRRPDESTTKGARSVIAR